MPDESTALPITVEVGPLLVPPEGPRPGVELLHDRVSRELLRLMGILGVPGSLEMEVRVAAERARADGLRMWVHGRECRYPPELLSRVWSTLIGSWLAPAHEHVSPLAAGRPTARIPDFVATVCREIVTRRPSVLLGTAQAERYVAGTETEGADPEWVLGTLARVLDARIALTDRAPITTALVEQRGKLSSNVSEVLIERVRPPALTVVATREYLRELTTSPWATGALVVEDVRARVEDDLGIAPPPVVFAEDRSLPERGFAFVVGDIETLTWIGLPADRCLVGDAVETLEALGIRGEPALHPVSDNECAVVPMAEREAVRSFHLPTWDPDEYLGLCLEATMRAHASCLVDAATVRARLEGLTTQGASSVVLGRRLPVGRVMRLLRALLAERLSVSDFPTLVEVLAEQAEELRAREDDEIWSNRADVAQQARDREANAAARRRLSRQVAGKVVQDGAVRSVPAVVLDPRLLQAIPGATAADHALETEHDELLNLSVARFLDSWPGDRWPALLTSAKSRGAVRAALAPQFPDLPVVAYEELPVDVELKMVGTIATAEG